MAFTSLQDAEYDVEVYPATAFPFKASGAIKAGQAVKFKTKDTVVVTTATTCPCPDKTLGIAAYDASHGKKLGVYMNGSYVRTRFSGAGGIVGDWVWGAKTGYVRSGNATYKYSTQCFAQIMKSTNSNTGIIEILIH